MNYGHIDFLPKSYREQQAQQSRGWRQWMLLLIVAVGLAGWWHVMRTETHELRTTMLQVENEVAVARDQRTTLVQLKEEHTVLTQQIAVYQELKQPIDHSRVVTELINALPASIMLEELQVDTHRPKAQAHTSSKKSKKKKQPVKQARNDLEISFEGIAPDHLIVAETVSRLSEHALFGDVSLLYSRTQERHGVEARVFRVRLKVDLDRRFEWNDLPKEVADAS